VSVTLNRVKLVTLLQLVLGLIICQAHGTQLYLCMYRHEISGQECKKVNFVFISTIGLPSIRLLDLILAMTNVEFVIVGAGTALSFNVFPPENK